MDDCERCGDKVLENSHPPELCDSCAFKQFSEHDGEGGPFDEFYE